MLLERSELTAKPGTEQDFHAALSGRATAILNSVPGVLSVQIGRGVENPGKFIMLVGWASMEAHTAYRALPQSTELRALMGPFVAGGAMEHFAVG